MTPVLSHALEGLVLELARLEQLLKALECLDSRRSKHILKNAREKFRSVADSLRSHLIAEAPEGVFSAASGSSTAQPSAKRQRTLDPVLFTRADADSQMQHVRDEESSKKESTSSVELVKSEHFCRD